MNRNRWLTLPLALTLTLAAQDRRIAPVAQGPRRVALVVGNDAYRDHPLHNAVNDAQAVRAALAEVGFEVDLKLNTGMAQMEQAAGEFAARVRPGDVAVFYYSGHGMQVGDQNYLIPVDFDARTAVDAKYKSYAASRIQENLEAAGAGLQIIVLDACRDNPYRSLRSGAGGLAPMEAGKGTYIAFATGPGRTADDNAAGRNGLFTGALVATLREPGLTLDQVFNRVRAQVAARRPEQVPWSSSNVLGEFYFRPAAPGATAKPDVEAEYWAECKQHGSDFCRAYLDTYPQGVHARLAKAMLEPKPEAAASPAPAPTIPPARPTAGATKVNPKDGLTYVWIPPGTFTMGCSPGDEECLDDEKPAHEVTITRGFWLGQTPVTTQAYERMRWENPSEDARPVMTVTWEESRAYCAAIGGRLPTEAEWEYAARAGSTGARYGNLDDIAWHRENSAGQMTHEVAKKAPNAFGLYDMLGNVWQWVADWYGDYQSGEQSDPSGPASGQLKALRGGSWHNDPRFVRVSGRFRDEPGNRSLNVGLRCVGE